MSLWQRPNVIPVNTNPDPAFPFNKTMAQQPAPPPADPPKKAGPFRILLYLLLAIAAISLLLELTGTADVAGKRETDTIIERPHD